MKKILSLMLLSLLAHNVYATDNSMNYVCQNNRSVKVNYYFNEQGLPTQATAIIDGVTRVMPINLGLSDNTATVFGQEGQYVLSAGYLDSSNFQSSQMLLTSPDNEILFKNCSVKNTAPAKKNKEVSGKVHYACQSGKSVDVTYSFNAQGLPSKATANIGGKQRHMPINLSLSDHTGTTFGEEGQYMLSANYIDSQNYRRSSILVTSPENEILFKNCDAK